MDKKTKVPKDKKELMEVVPKAKETKGVVRKIKYILDTNVPLYDDTCFWRFAEHDIGMFFTSLKEFENLKVKNKSARSLIKKMLYFVAKKKAENEVTTKVRRENKKRYLSLEKKESLLLKGIPLGKGLGKFEIYMADMQPLKKDLSIYPDNADRLLLNGILYLMEEESKKPLNKQEYIVLVTRDQSLRLFAHILGINVEDYKNDQLDIDELLGNNVIINKKLKSVINEVSYKEIPLTRLNSIASKKIKSLFYPNKYLILKEEKGAKSCEVKISSDMKSIRKVNKTTVYNVTPRNLGQTFCVDAILDPDINLILLDGLAGSGKTLLGIAAGFHLMEKYPHRYKKMIMTCAMVATGDEDMGAMPGDATDKISPYMSGLMGNLDFIEELNGGGDNSENLPSQKKGKSSNQKKAVVENFNAVTKTRQTTNTGASIRMVLGHKVIIQAKAFTRGATYPNAVVIVDEFQNLKLGDSETLITRAGENCKIIACGDTEQVDAPHMSSESNGLTKTVDVMKGDEHTSFIKLEDVERSELAKSAANRFRAARNR